MRHSKIQTTKDGAQIYKCMKCSKTCATTGGMSKHYKVNHPITPGEATPHEDE